MRSILSFARLLAVVSLVLACSCAKKIKVDAEGARAIAKEAYVYGLPIVDNYKVMYAYALYKQSGAFKAPFNALAIVTPDTAQTDSTHAHTAPRTPYGLSWLDLRKEPAVITVPPMENGREFSVQLVDMYTFHFAELTSGEHGEAGGQFMIVPGQWSGKAPNGISKVIPCETTIALAIIRVKSRTPETTARTEAFLSRFNVETLSQFLGTSPNSPDAVIFPPYSPETAQGAGFFQYLNFALQFCPVNPSEIQDRAQFAKLGIAAGKTFNIATMDKAMLDAINAGMADARAEIASEISNTPEGAAQYGTRAQLKNNFLARAAAAKIRLYGPPRL